MPQQAASKPNPIQDYVTVAERIEKFYERYPEGRIITHIVEHDVERGFILMRAEVYRNPEDAMPAATGHAFELRSEGYVNRTSYIENCESSAVGRGLALCGFEVRRGIASREEVEKIARAPQQISAAAGRDRNKAAPAPSPAASSSAAATAATNNQLATEDQKEEILNLLESLRPADRRAQHRMLVEMTGKESRDDLTQREAVNLIQRLKREVAEGSI